MSRARGAVAGAFLMALWLAPACIAQNLVANPDFDHDGSGWGDALTANGSAIWAGGEDADFCAASGALHLTNNDTTGDNAQQTIVGGCIDVSALAGQSARLEASVRFSTTFTVEQPTAAIAVAFYGSTDCSGDPTGGAGTPAADWGSAFWQDLRSAPFALPDGSVRVFLGLTKKLATDPTVDAYFDRVYLGLDSFVFGDGFELAGTCRWSP